MASGFFLGGLAEADREAAERRQKQEQIEIQRGGLDVQRGDLDLRRQKQQQDIATQTAQQAEKDAEILFTSLTKAKESGIPERYESVKQTVLPYLVSRTATVIGSRQPMLPDQALAKAQEFVSARVAAIDAMPDVVTAGDLQGQAQGAQATAAAPGQAQATAIKAPAEASAEAQKQAAVMVAKYTAGQKMGIPDENSIKNEDDLRKELEKETATFKTMDEYYQSIRKAFEQPNGVNDYAMVVSIAKMLDPSSVVREGEVETVKKTAGLPDQIYGAWTKLQGEGSLSPAIRKQIFDLGTQKYEIGAARAQERGQQYREIATRRNLDVRNILPAFLQNPTPTGGAGNQAPKSPNEWADKSDDEIRAALKKAGKL